MKIYLANKIKNDLNTQECIIDSQNIDSKESLKIAYFNKEIFYGSYTRIGHFILCDSNIRIKEKFSDLTKKDNITFEIFTSDNFLKIKIQL